MLEPNVVRQRPEQRNSRAKENREAGDGHALDQPLAQEALDGHAAVDVEVLQAPAAPGGPRSHGVRRP